MTSCGPRECYLEFWLSGGGALSGNDKAWRTAMGVWLRSQSVCGSSGCWNHHWWFQKRGSESEGLSFWTRGLGRRPNGRGRAEYLGCWSCKVWEKCLWKWHSGMRRTLPHPWCWAVFSLETNSATLGRAAGDTVSSEAGRIQWRQWGEGEDLRNGWESSEIWVLVW